MSCSHKVKLHLYEALFSQDDQCTKVRSVTSVNSQNILLENGQNKQFCVVYLVYYFQPNCVFMTRFHLSEVH